MIRSTLELVKNGEESLAEQLQTQIESLIRTGKLTAGDRLPSFRKLSRQLGVSIGTIRQAMEVLKARGILEVEHGRGVFVRSAKDKNLNIAFICPALMSSDLDRILSGVNEVFGKRKVQLILKMSPRAFQNEIENINSIQAADVDGCLIVPPTSSECIGIFQALKNKGVPYVFIDTIPGDIDANAVTTDCRFQGYMAVEYLIRNGHRNIAVVDHNGTALTNQLRRTGFDAALQTIGKSLSTIPYVQIPILDPDDPSQFCRIEIVDRYIKGILQDNRDITAVVGIHGYMAINIVNVCHEIGLQVPDDISVIGLGDSQSTAKFCPMLTIVDTVAERIGMRAARRLIEIIENKGEFLGKCSEKILLSPQLVEKSSIRKI